MLRELRTGILYRNPKPHVRSEHAYFPSVAVDGRNWLATVVLGEAFESPDLHTCLFRSGDEGETWQFERRLRPAEEDAPTPVSDCSRISRTAENEFVVLMVVDDRSAHPDEGLANPETLGHVPNTFHLMYSRDGGDVWSPPAPIDPPLTGSCFELCCPIVALRPDFWLLPTSTWPDWGGNAPNGWRMVALISRDGGVTWPDYTTVMHDPRQHIIFWESKIVVLPDNRLLAVAWAWDRIEGRDLPNQFCLSDDAGATWTPPRSTGLLGQTMTPLVLPDGRILSLYRRMDEPGLWAVLSHIENGRWINDAFQSLWGAYSRGLTGDSTNAITNFNVLRFGAPCLMLLADGSVFAAFWGYEDCVSVIRWFRFRVA